MHLAVGKLVSKRRSRPEVQEAVHLPDELLAQYCFQLAPEGREQHAERTISLDAVLLDLRRVVPVQLEKMAERVLDLGEEQMSRRDVITLP